MLQTWDWVPCPKRAYQTEIDPEFSCLPKYDGFHVEKLVLVTGFVEGHWVAELYEVYKDKGISDVCACSGYSRDEVCKAVCIRAASHGIPDRIVALGQVDEAKLACDGWALWANEPAQSPHEDFEWFLHEARMCAMSHDPYYWNKYAEPDLERKNMFDYNTGEKIASKLIDIIAQNYDVPREFDSDEASEAWVRATEDVLKSDPSIQDEISHLLAWASCDEYAVWKVANGKAYEVIGYALYSQWEFNTENEQYC